VPVQPVSTAAVDAAPGTTRGGAPIVEHTVAALLHVEVILVMMLDLWLT